MTKPLDLNKPIRCDDGSHVRSLIMHLNNGFDRKLTGEIGCITQQWDLAGNPLNEGSQTRLVNAPEPIEVWINIYKLNNKYFFGEVISSREQADRYAVSNRCGRRRIVIDNPEGFDE